ncbi:MAG: DUF2076 domain-containing protein [Methylobacterium mesophilicum]|nr:DUF2076 domain-containing protein [Methylobacterium mesophilicum]
MDRNDAQAIEGLFGKLANVERQSLPRDKESEDFINGQLAQQPAAPYYMAQTIIVQEQALEAAQRRIEELEAQSAPQQQSSGGGGLFGSLFGGGNRASPARSGSVPRVAGTASAGGVWGQGNAAAPQGMMGQRAGGGFLAGAAQTAMGVAGGVLLGNAVAGMFGGNEAQAAEAPAETPAEQPQAEEAGFDDGGGFDDMEF